MKTTLSACATLAIGLGLGAGCGSSGESVPTTFDVDPTAEGARVELRSTELTADRARFDVHAVGVDDVYAMSFRLRYDAESFELESATVGAGAASPNAIVRAKEAQPGLVFVVVSERGEVPARAWMDTSVVELAFKRKGPRGGSRFAFEPARSRILTPGGQPTPHVGWIGGRIN